VLTWGRRRGGDGKSVAINKVKTQSITITTIAIAKADLFEISLFIQNVTKDMTKWMANQFRETVNKKQQKKHKKTTINKKRCMNHRRQKKPQQIDMQRA